MKPNADARPIGTLIQNSQLQEKSRMITLPSTGPSTAQVAHTLAR